MKKEITTLFSVSTLTASKGSKESTEAFSPQYSLHSPPLTRSTLTQRLGICSFSFIRESWRGEERSKKYGKVLTDRLLLPTKIKFWRDININQSVLECIRYLLGREKTFQYLFILSEYSSNSPDVLNLFKM